MISLSQRPLRDETQHSQQTNIHVPGGIRTHNLSSRATADLRLRQRGNLYVFFRRKFWKNDGFTPSTHDQQFFSLLPSVKKFGTIRSLTELLLWILLLEVKRSGLSPPNSAQIENAWSYPFTFSYAFMTWTGTPFYCVIYEVSISKITAQIWVNFCCLLSGLSECKWGKFIHFGCSSPHKAQT